MLNEKETTKISKFLSLVLRHQPEELGITLDSHGWTDTQILLNKLNQKGFKIDFELLKFVVDTNSKKRFSFNETFDKIRASQGHTVEVELGYTPQKPPALLYHGTTQQSVSSILTTGIEKRDRHHVHLSPDVETAVKVGSRRGKPVILEVLSEQMHQDQFKFFLSDNGVWLTDYVPAKYIKESKK